MCFQLIAVILSLEVLNLFIGIPHSLPITELVNWKRMDTNPPETPTGAATFQQACKAHL
jgi:hypothetical protein